MADLLTSRAVDRGFGPRSRQTNDFEIGIYRFSANHASLRNESKAWMTRIEDSVSEWRDMSTHGLSFQWFSTKMIQC